MRKRNVDALNLKPGPTESGVPVPPRPRPVGGNIAPIDAISVFLSQYGLLIMLLLIPFAFLLYKKRGSLLNLLVRAQMTLWRLTR